MIFFMRLKVLELFYKKHNFELSIKDPVADNRNEFLLVFAIKMNC